MTKSYVAMGYKTCPVCHTKHDEVVLLNKRMKASFEESGVFMGYELCPEHIKMSDEYLTVVGGEAGQFTGEVAHLRWHVAFDIFNHISDKSIKVVFAEQAVIDHLKQLASKSI